MASRTPPTCCGGTCPLGNGVPPGPPPCARVEGRSCPRLLKSPTRESDDTWPSAPTALWRPCHGRSHQKPPEPSEESSGAQAGAAQEGRGLSHGCSIFQISHALGIPGVKAGLHLAKGPLVPQRGGLPLLAWPALWVALGAGTPPPGQVQPRQRWGRRERNQARKRQK